MKILKSSHISPFGGLHFVLEEFERLGLGKLLSANLPELAPQTTYQWRDILYSFWAIYFCGGDCIEDISINLKSHIQTNPFFKVPSPDRILDRFKELAITKDIFSKPRGRSLHQFSLHPVLNELNVKVLHQLGFDPNQEHILDYDNTILHNNKQDSINTYKKVPGYYPGVGIIKDKIVFVENRNGNSDAKTLQFETLTRMFRLLKEQDIKIDSFRADSASYLYQVVELVKKNTNHFYIRARMDAPIAKAIREITHWQTIVTKSEIILRAEIPYKPFIRAHKEMKSTRSLETYRLIISKVKRRDNQINLFTNEAYLYSAILTNNWEKDTHKIVHFYNQRGAIEKEFDILKNDFGWKKLPFSKLEQNTVFLLFTAMCRNLYQYIIKRFSKRFKYLKPTFRIKKFIFRFMTIPAKWIKTSRQYKLRIYGNIHFKT